ncbi:MAG: hypothetical protein U0165_03215 [Polyangiaceae bacterium]
MLAKSLSTSEREPPSVVGGWARFNPWIAWIGITIGAVIAFVHGKAMYWLCDDAFISFRYVRNLVRGEGLVFNIGERVEGYTNFLWVLELGAIWKLFGVEPPTASVVLSALYSAALLGIVAWMAWRSPAPARGLAVLTSLVLLATNRSFAVWCSSGLETRQFTVFVVGAVALLAASAVERAKDVERERSLQRWLVGASLLLGAAELTRPEASLIFASCFAWLVLDRTTRIGLTRLNAQPLQPRAALRSLLADAFALGLPFTLIVVSHYVWRRGYYGDWLPNTYYAKHVRPWTESGDHYFFVAALEHGLEVVIPVALLGAVLRLMNRDSTHVLSAMVLIPHAIYVRRIGGDHFEFRPLDFYWPLLAVAASDGLLLGPSLARKTFERDDLLLWIVSIAGLGLLLEYGTILQRAHEALTVSKNNRGNAYKLYAEVTIKNTPELASLYWLPEQLEDYNTSSWYCVDHQSCTRRGEHRAYWQLLESEYGPYRELDRLAHELIPRGGVWAREAVGIAPYYLPNIDVIDLYGLTDAVIARTPVERSNKERVMAHDRHPPPGYLDQRGVNMTVGAASRSQGEVLYGSYWALKLRDDLWMPFLSANGDWVIRTFAKRPLYSQFHLDPENIFDNCGWVEATFVRGETYLGRFDDETIDGWTQVEGDPIESSDISLAVDGFGAYGMGWLTTRGRASRTDKMARIVSPQVKAHGVLFFLMGGAGDEDKAGVALSIDGKLVQRWLGHGAQHFEQFTFDLRPFEGHQASIEVFDHLTSTHVDLDQVMIADSPRVIESDRDERTER